MSIIKFIKKVCVQPAVYWGSPQENGFGGKTYALPVEIKCRWEDKEKVIYAVNGEEVISIAEVLVTQDLDFNGVLYLGELNDISILAESDGSIDPDLVDGSFLIIQRDKIPLFKSKTEFVYKVYVGNKK